MSNTALIIERGTFRLGHTTRDKDGNVVEKVEPSWTPDPEGGSLILVPYDRDKGEYLASADIFVTWDTSTFSKKIMEQLAIQLTDLPDLSEMRLLAMEDDVKLCDYCPGLPHQINPCAICVLDE